MSFQATGKVVHIGQMEGGVSKRGNQWNKLNFVIELQDRERHKIPFEIWGQHATEAKLEMDMLVDVMFDIDGRLYNDRWYTSAVAFYVRPHQEQTSAQNIADKVIETANEARKL